MVQRNRRLLAHGHGARDLPHPLHRGPRSSLGHGSTCLCRWRLDGGNLQDQAATETPSLMEKVLMNSLFLRFLKDDSAATAIEYALLAAGISLAIIVTVNSLGTQLSNTFASV